MTCLKQLRGHVRSVFCFSVMVRPFFSHGAMTFHFRGRSGRVWDRLVLWSIASSQASRRVGTSAGSRLHPADVRSAKVDPGVAGLLNSGRVLIAGVVLLSLELGVATGQAAGGSFHKFKKGLQHGTANQGRCSIAEAALSRVSEELFAKAASPCRAHIVCCCWATWRLVKQSLGVGDTRSRSS